MNLELPNLDQFDALLFDLDGTLVDSMSVHTSAWMMALSEVGLSIDESYLLSLAGTPNVKTVEIFNQRFGWSLDPQSFAKRKDSLFLKNIHKTSPIEIVISIAKKFHQQKPMAVVSGSTREMVHHTLTSSSLDVYFPIRVCAEDTPQGKPHPGPFLRGAELLGVDPKACIVFEDGQAGIQSALSAGMTVIKVESPTKLSLLNF